MMRPERRSDPRLSGDFCALRDRRATGSEPSALTWSLQALLIRHEAYIAEAEAERERMNAHVSAVESANHELELSNAQLLDENKSLAEQVEHLHRAVEDADTHVQSLTTTLQTTQLELEKVNRLAKRTELLESQLLECEREQAQLQATLTRTVEEERAATQRWRASQRKILELQEQMDAIEKDAKQERLIHEEALDRLRRRQAVEKELDDRQTVQTADGHERKGSEVVSSFVKEILQDNANMQLAMVELQDLLAYYRDGQHDDSPELKPLGGQRQVSLGEELGLTTEQQRQELHVHHHYHAPKRDKAARPQPVVQRSRRKRPVLLSGRSSGRSTPIDFAPESSRPAFRHKAASSTSSSNFSLDRGHTLNRLSVQSTASQTSSALTSNPSSPRASSYCPSTIFERAFGDEGTDNSRPTSPEGSDQWSPMVRPIPSKQAQDDIPYESLSLPAPDSPLHASRETIRANQVDVGFFTEDPVIQPPSQTQPHSSNAGSQSPQRRPLRRTDSHASLFSISGMDIHTSLPPPSQPTFPIASRMHSGPVTTAATASATSHNGSSLSPGRVLRGRLNPAPSKSARYDPLTDTFGNFKRVGGWLRWRTSSGSDLRNDDSSRRSTTVENVAAASSIPEEDTLTTDGKSLEPASVSELPSKTVDVDVGSIKSSTSVSTVGQAPKTKPVAPVLRPPGVNQTGGLPPLPQPRPRVAIMRGKLDEEALRECLDE